MKNSSKFINLLRTITFDFILIAYVIFLGILTMPFSFFSLNMTRKISTFWAKSVLLFLKYICGIQYEIINHNGDMNMNNTPKIIISKHQSAWETIFLSAYFNCPAFVLKKELLSIPIYGSYLKLTDMIVIDRKNGIAAIKSIMQNVPRVYKQNRSIVIFPEGTRVKVGEAKKFQKGVFAILQSLEDVEILPVGLNSGHFWPKNGYIKNPGTVKVHFLKIRKINYKRINSEEKENLLNDLENEINMNSL